MPTSWYPTKTRIGQSTETTAYLAGSAGKILLKIIVRRLSEYCERVGILLEEQRGFRVNSSTTDMMLVFRRLQELVWKKLIPLYVCFIDLPKAYDSVDRTLLWRVLPRFGLVCHKILSRLFVHPTMAYQHACGSTTGCAWDGSLWNRAFVKGVRSRPSCSLFFFLAVTNVADTRFKADKDIMDALVHPSIKRGRGGGGGDQRRGSPRDVYLGHALR